jgi:hypothetical protein
MSTFSTPFAVSLAALAAAAAGAAALAGSASAQTYSRGDSLIVSCASDSYEKRICSPRGETAVDASVVRRIGNARCTRRDDWDVADGVLWVRNGCRADFEVFLARSDADTRYGDDGRRYEDDRRYEEDPRYEDEPRYEDDGELAGGVGDRRYDPVPRSGDWRRDRGLEESRIERSVRACSRAATEEAWDRDAYSIQYVERPRLEEGRRGFELRGRMRIHDEDGFTTVRTACQVRRGEVIDFLIYN